jgi:pimeloyl-ACP methyl ester carboxylesterase
VSEGHEIALSPDNFVTGEHMGKRSTTFIASTEPGVQLELIAARPHLNGRYPTLIFNHGSTGRASPSVIARTMCPSAIQNYFTERGWLVLFPQRRGRGKSGGKYAEGLTSDGKNYSCDHATAMRGFERAVEDLDAVMAHVKTRDDVDLNRIVIGGVSRGGILSIAYAGLRSGWFSGAINFNGGWMGQGCSTYETINSPIFNMGATAGFPTLWLHGTQDQYYPISHCRSNFDSYTSAGGKGTFIAAVAGHALIYKPDRWTHAVESYLEKTIRN